MADIRISQLPAATLPLAGTELFPVVQNGDTKRVPASSLGTTEINILAYGAVGDGVANDAVAFQAAVTAASASGAVLTAPAGSVFRLGSSVTCSGGLRMRGNFTITQPTTHAGVVISPTFVGSTSISAIDTVTHPTTTGIQQVTRLTVGNPTGFARGGIVHVYSADTYSWDASAKRAEQMMVADVDAVNNYVFLSGKLKDTFTTSVNVLRLNPAVVNIDGPTFTYDGDWLAPTTNTRHAALTIIGAVTPRVRATFRNDVSMGLALYSCWHADVDISAQNLRNDVPDGFIGYGVAVYSACRGGLFTVRANNVRHAYTDGIWATTDPIRMGRAREITVTGYADNCTAAAWDTHAGAVDVTFYNCRATFNQTNNELVSRDTAYGFQDRALNTKIINPVVINPGAGAIYLANATVDYGETNTLEIVGGQFYQDLASEKASFGIPARTTTSGYFVNVRNCTFTGFRLGQTKPTASPTVAIQRYYDCTFNFATFQVANDSGAYEFHGCKFYLTGGFRTGSDNIFTFINCSRFNTNSSAEGLVVNQGSTATIHNWYCEAPSYGNSAIINAGGGGDTGNITLNIGTLHAKGVQLKDPIRKVTTGTLTVNRMTQGYAPARIGTTANRPTLTANDIGYFYMDTDLDADGKPIWYNGTAWVDATGATV